MTRINLLLLLTVILGYTACQSNRQANEAFLATVEKDFEVKQAALPDGDLFAVFRQSLTEDERNALMFLYAYMPIGDITDYTGQFYLDNIRSSFRARVEMPWGKEIPEQIFRHYVLPIRVNNENLDLSRLVFYDELRDRVKGLSLYDAVLEVNHWCHEKVIYTPSDARTSSPLASVKSAYGRCGEESTFTVAALRSVGIPARQVYTPRWAHTDDNHAWVEAWVDGKWYFLGACEPEPVLNLGWFNGPVYRGMLMHTKVFGHYRGTEEIMSETANYTEINVTNNYASTASVTVHVKNVNGQVVEGADVEFKLYNYAEFYTVAHKVADEQGTASLTAGKGDMLVWASHEGRFGYSKVSFGKDTEITIILDKQPGDTGELTLDVIPPVDGSIPAEVTDDQKATNAIRLAEEDKIRNQYVATFPTAETAAEWGKAYGVHPEKVATLLIASRGNSANIKTFLEQAKAEGLAERAINLLCTISQKDLRDTEVSVLLDHLTSAGSTSALYNEYILNPRVANELLTPYKQFFVSNFDPQAAETARQDPETLIQWVREHIRLCDELNSQRIPIMPRGVWRARAADRGSRNIFFVALCRSLFIPARIEPVAGKVQYANSNGKWIDVDFETTTPVVTPQGKAVASYQPIKALRDPKYYTHFSIAKVLPNAKLQTLNFESGEVDMGLGDTWSTLLKQPLAMDCGAYLLVTGTRMANGSVLAKLRFFNVKEGETTPFILEMRENLDDVQVIGNFNSEDKYLRADNGEETSLLATTGRGYYIVALLGARQEPTNHAMRDIAAVKADLEEWGRSMVLLFPNEKDYQSFDPKEFGELPNTITYGIDRDRTIQDEIVEAMKLNNANDLPIFIIADTFNRVVFISQGYTIGLGEQLMKVIHKL